MNRILTAVTSWFLIVTLLVTQASAHYLWVTIDAKSGEHGTANVYFEGGPSAGDGHYLDNIIARGKTWIRTLGQDKPTELKVQDVTAPGKRWLSTSLPEAGPRSVDSVATFGVYRYGETDVLLHYYARNLQVDDHDDLHELGRSKQMKLDIVPHDEAGAMQLTVLWNGKPVSKRPISIRGPAGFKANLTTDAKGHASFAPKGKGRYTLRTSVEEKKEGTDKGKTYQLIRHHSTMVINLPL